ncbi:MAG: hypothetical protein HOG12_18240 [Alphaproteobacteria bacterium]|jgi:hypothetical protein|nr:hypothetical protein [Alphaproteobacteria bacterium]
MRAWEFITEVQRVPPMSLRHINKMKKDEEARQASFDRRDAMLPIMYGNPAKELERIELRKAYIELAQQEAELANTRAAANRESWKEISRMAAAGIETRKANQKKINDMAARGLGRHKKA